MINTLRDYISRSLPEYGDFATNPNLMKKVDGEGKMLPFFGNTAVFLPDADAKACLALVRDGLYRAAEDMLAEPLLADTFHLTLHDLANGTAEDRTLYDRMRSAEVRARNVLADLASVGEIRLRATMTFNMVNTSVVLGFEPQDEESLYRLDKMYCALEAVVPLGYAMTPHITLAYYRPGVYGADAVARLRSALGEVSLALTLSDPVLQVFGSMNQYQTI